MRPRLLDLPSGKSCTIDEADWPKVRPLTLYLGGNGYVYYCRWSNGKSRPDTLHAFLVGTVSGMHIDHINGDKTDNRRSNLRLVTPQRNQVNRKRLSAANTSGTRGVRHRSGTPNPWIAQITANRRNYYLGSFLSLADAIVARRAAELLYFGEECPR
jgi:hypothetical protein